MPEILSPPPKLIDSSLCCGCGLCAGVCPSGALEMRMHNGYYIPVFRPDLCSGCNICEKVCYQGEIDLGDEPSWNSKRFHHYLGHFANLFTGFSTDPTIRRKGASGGLISTLLIYLLESGQIDGVIVTNLRCEGREIGEITTFPFIAKNRGDILAASGSRYLPVEFSGVINQVMEKEGKYAIVGLPCLISNLRKAKRNLPILDQRIKYLFGLFCSNNFSYSLLGFIRAKTGIGKVGVESLDFRADWPDSLMSIRTREGEYRLKAKDWDFLFSLKMYPVKSCLLCEDCFAEFADISFGDAWLREFKEEGSIGISICVPRTGKGQELVSAAEKSGLIWLKRIEPSAVIESQRFAIYFKKFQAPFLRGIREGRFGSSEKLWPQVLLTTASSLILAKFSNKFPEGAGRIPSLLYRLIFWIISICVISLYRMGMRRRS